MKQDKRKSTAEMHPLDRSAAAILRPEERPSGQPFHLSESALDTFFNLWLPAPGGLYPESLVMREKLMASSRQTSDSLMSRLSSQSWQKLLIGLSDKDMARLLEATLEASGDSSEWRDCRGARRRHDERLDRFRWRIAEMAKEAEWLITHGMAAAGRGAPKQLSRQMVECQIVLDELHRVLQDPISWRNDFPGQRSGGAPGPVFVRSMDARLARFDWWTGVSAEMLAALTRAALNLPDQDAEGNRFSAANVREARLAAPRDSADE